jgi:hypothetical protein
MPWLPVDPVLRLGVLLVLCLWALLRWVFADSRGRCSGQE